MRRPVRLRTFLGLLLIATTALTMALVGGLILTFRIPQINAESATLVQEEAQEKARLLDLALAGMEAQMLPVAAMATHAPLAAIDETLRTLLIRSRQFRAAYAVDGTGIIRAGGFLRSDGRIAPARGGDLSRNPLLDEVNARGSAWSDKYLSAQSGDVVVGVALREGEWTVIGEIAPDYLRDSVSAVAGHGTNRVLVVDRAGEWIAGNAPGHGQGDNLGHLPIVRAALAGQQRGTLASDGNEQVFAGSARPARIGWTFIVSRPSGMDNPDIRRTVLTTLAGFGGSLLIGLLIAPWWARYLSRPLRRLIDRSHQLAEGRYAVADGDRSHIVELDAFADDLQRTAEAIAERERSLARSEERLRATLENSPAVAIQWYDRDGVCRYWNPASTLLYGYSAEEALGQTLEARMFSPAQQAAFVDTLQQIEATGEPVPAVEFETRCRNGELKTVLCSLFAIPDAQGGRQFVCLDIDITDRKRAESALLASQKELLAIFNASPVAMSVSDLSRGGRILKVNDAWVRQFGHLAEAAFGRTGTELGLYADPADRENFVVRYARGVGSYDDVELWLRRSDGRPLLCRVATRVIEVAGQQLLLMTSEDITEERRMQNELRNVNEELEARVLQRTAALSQSNEELAAALDNLRQAQGKLVQAEKLAALGRLVAGVAHELNTPIGNTLMAITTLAAHREEFRRMSSAGLRRSTLEAFVGNVGAATEIATRNLERAAELIASFKQVAADQASSQRRVFDLKTVVDEVLVALRPSLSCCRQRIEAQIPSGLRFDSYPGPLGQVLVNLIDNAIKHAFGGRDEGRIELFAEAVDDRHVRIVVADDGCGIAAEHLPRIFDPFFTTRLGQGGSGLGLNIAHNIVTGVLGGQIEVRSDGRSGTRFTLTLPCVAPATADALAA